MKKIHQYFIANWKMELLYTQARQWIQQNKNPLATLAKKSTSTIVLCPSFESIAMVYNEVKDTVLMLGAQDCSAYARGAYTGQVSAQSLTEMGCHYCIIGHSERFEYAHEAKEDIGNKLLQTISAGITPVICVGDSAQEYQSGKTIAVLESRIDFILDNIPAKTESLIIAYEPRWAVGTDKTPTPAQIQAALASIKQRIAARQPTLDCPLLYGGSVNDSNVSQFKAIDILNGFLLGRSSLDFQTLEKIVLSE